MLERLGLSHFFFTAGLIGTLSSNLFLPNFQLAFFAPYLILKAFEGRMEPFLVRAMLVGAFLDIASGYSHMGIFCLAYLGSGYLIFKMRGWFFQDSFFTLPVLSAIFASLSTALLFFVVKVFEEPLPFSLYFVVTDLIVYPLADALYAAALSFVPLVVLKVKARPERSLKKSRPV